MRNIKLNTQFRISFLVCSQRKMKMKVLYLALIFIGSSLEDSSASTSSSELQIIRKVLADSMNQTMDYIKLSAPGTVLMPIVGLGTWKARLEEIDSVLLDALDAGYRHIDTAFIYQNEEAIGTTLKKWIDSGKGKREDVFITTKLPVYGNRASDVEKYLKWSLKNLQTDYVDLYLIHVPFSIFPDETGLGLKLNDDGSTVLDVNNDNIQTWKVMEEFVKQGKIRAIGLSNFNATQVQNIYDNSEIKPSVLQIELHLYHQQKKLRSLCKELNIAVTAYSPLGSPDSPTYFKEVFNYSVPNYPSILKQPVVNELADKYDKSAAQIALRFLVQQNIIVIPKSSNAERIKQNLDIFYFELTQEDMEKLNSLDRDKDDRIFDFTFFKGVDAHPQYPFKIK